MIEIDRVGPDDWLRWRELRLEALLEAPHAFSSTLSAWQGDGDQKTRWRERLSAVPFNIIARREGVDSGISSGTQPVDGVVELISMWVAPLARRSGVADALVDAVISWARSSEATRVTLAVFEDNAPAIALYRRHGFTDRGVAEGGEPARATERAMTRVLE